MSTGPKDTPGFGATGAPPQGVTPADPATQSAFDEVQQIQAQDAQRREQLLEMLIEDARSGRVKDPEGRNVKGRRDKHGGPKVGRRDGGAATKGATKAESVEPSEDSLASDGASGAIDQASSAVNSLRAAITDTDDAEGEKLVRLHKLV